MAARINNIPTGIIFDATYLTTTSEQTHGSTVNDSGTLALTKDRDLTTNRYLRLTDSYYATIDYIYTLPRQFWNLNIRLKAQYTTNATTRAYSGVDVSTDGTNWTNIHSNIVYGSDVNLSLGALTAKYVKVFMSTSSGSSSTNTSGLYLYEITISGGV